MDTINKEVSTDMVDVWIDAIPENVYDPCPCGCGMKWKFAREEPEKHEETFKKQVAGHVGKA